MNLIGSSVVVVYSLIEHNSVCCSSKRRYLDCSPKPKILGFGLQSIRVSTKTIRLLALVFYEQ